MTHTEKSVDLTDPAAARERAEGSPALARGMLQNQHLMGFGALNPEPVPGRRDWTTLDMRFDLIERTAGSAVLTIAVAPDWMKGGRPGETDWSKIEVAPLRQNFGAFTSLAVAALERYPQITHVQVWNELKGFFDDRIGDWDKEGYTLLYNQVHDAVKAIRPDVKVGGPYMTLALYRKPPLRAAPSEVSGPWGTVDQRALNVVDYWLANSRGADFVVVDGGTATQDAGLIVPSSESTAFFSAVTSWVRRRTDLPVWWSEFYVPTEDSAKAESAESAASAVEAVAEMARSGASAALLWQPQASNSFPFPALWTSTATPDGGAPTALTEAWRWLQGELGSGDAWIGRSQDRSVIGFRGADEVLLLNTSNGDVTVSGNPDPVSIGPFRSVVIPNSATRLPEI